MYKISEIDDVISAAWQLRLQPLLKENLLMNLQVYSKWTGVVYS